jgi:peptide/nickel transport system substrate-binding protein
MLSRRTLMAAAAAAGSAVPFARRAAWAATPKQIVVMAKQIDDIVGAFDPAESYEFTNNEVCGNCYRKLLVPDPADTSKLQGDVAEHWDVSGDGLTFTFHIRPGIVFSSGKPLTADDVAFSLQRVVKLNKTPGFILTQFGFSADDVEKAIVATDPATVVMKLPQVQATSFVLYCLSATVGCIVEKAQAMANQTGGDLGNAWLKTHTAGAGSYTLVDWKASDHIILQANPHAAEMPKVPRLILRHVADPAAQLLLLRKGDADIARDLTADQIKGIAASPDYHVDKANQLTSMYVAMNEAAPGLEKQEVRQAIKMAIDYQAIADDITPNLWGVWESFLPNGVPGAISDTPFRKDPAGAKALLAKAGYPDGLSLTLDHFSKAPYPQIAQAMQADLAAIGIKLTLLPGEQKQVISKNRARKHQLLMTTWFPDYLDPNSNAQAFCANPDDSDASKLRSPAWRSHFFDKTMTQEAADAVKETDSTRRLALYAKMQRDFMQVAPFAFILQSNEVATLRSGVTGLRIGVLPDYTRYAGIEKA